MAENESMEFLGDSILVRSSPSSFTRSIPTQRRRSDADETSYREHDDARCDRRWPRNWRFIRIGRGEKDRAEKKALLANTSKPSLPQFFSTVVMPRPGFCRRIFADHLKTLRQTPLWTINDLQEVSRPTASRLELQRGRDGRPHTHENFWSRQTWKTVRPRPCSRSRRQK